MSLIGSTEADKQKSDKQTTDSKPTRLGRRNFLQVTSVAVGSFLSVGTASAAGGYGADGYGEGPFGGSTDSTGVAVSTGNATEIGTDAVTLNGSLDDLGGASWADCYFEYRESGASSWNATAPQTLMATGDFSESVSGLAPSTDYEFRSVATASDSDTGATISFTTDTETSDGDTSDGDTSDGDTSDGDTSDGDTSDGDTGDNSPVCDSYTVTEAGSPNPHADITADWTVSDTDGDLSHVIVRVTESSGSVVDSSRTSLSGSSGSARNQFKIKHAKGATFDVTLTVTDNAGNSTSQIRTVTE